MSNGYRASDILKMLEVKHAKDVFVPECKDGPTWLGSHLRLDAWVMNRSWSKPKVTGYEIKVSRSDFLGDDKWRGYLDYCNEFYFVAPPGVISPDELGPEAGLYLLSKTGAKLFRKKKAQYRDVVVPESLYRYILMSRVKITKEIVEPDKLEYWRKYVEDKKEKRELGYRVTGAIRKAFDDQQRKNDALENKIAKLEEFKRILVENGFDPLENSWRFRNRLEELKRGLPFGFEDGLRSVIKQSELILSKLQE